MTVSVFPGGAGTRKALPDCERPRCPGKVLDHICVVCGSSDLPGLDTPVDWLYELPTQLLAARGDLTDRAEDDPRWPEEDTEAPEPAAEPATTVLARPEPAAPPEPPGRRK